jgi:hypothetical protein
MDIQWYSREKLMREARRRMIRPDVVLDVGCGIRPQRYVFPRVHICVEAHLPYVERMQATPRFRDDRRFVFLNGTWSTVLPLLPADSVDTVFALDVIEHFEKAEGLRFLEEAARVARRQIVVFTPMGFFAQSCDGREDRWGMDGGHWQNHRSGWLPEDFGAGWEFLGCRSFIMVDDNESRLDEPVGAFWAIRTLAKGTGNDSHSGPRQRVIRFLRRNLPPVLLGRAGAILREIRLHSSRRER